MVIALTSHECDLGANTRPQVVMVSSVLLVLASALFFFFFAPVFIPLENQHSKF